MEAGKDDPTPTETEAPARFRVGHVERVAERVHNSWMVAKQAAGITSRKLDTTGEELLVPYHQLSEEAKELDRITVRTVLDAEANLEPADPAPPKPDKLTGPVEAFRAELCQALETSGNEAMKWLARELRGLEREGGGKS